jgi:hypothetical protein
MADIFNLGTPSDAIQDNALGTSGVRDGDALDTGVLRRKFNFGDRVSELSIPQDPFFRFVSKVGKQATDDPAFKFTEKRGSYHKRYAYIIGFVDNGSDEFADAELDQSDAASAVSAVGQNVELYMATDYKSAGNIQNVFGQSNGKIDVGASGTEPAFFLPGQMVKIPVSVAAGGAVAGYHVMKVTAVTDGLTKDSKEAVKLAGKIVKFDSASNFLAAFNAAGDFDPAGDDSDEDVHDQSISGVLEAARSYVIGSAFAEGSGYPETWKDQPYGTGYGQTQIWKTAMAMTNSMRATQLKYEQNEWSRIWREKLIEHKWDIEQSLLFGSQYTDSDGIQYTQGAVDFVMNFGNKFSLDIATKTADDFLDDMSNYLDPRYNSGSGTVFFCNTEVYNWLHKLGGYFKNNMEISANYRADMAITGKKKVFGVDITTISTPYGDMSVARNIHLDGTNIKLLGVNMNYAKYRPLVGNGLNRDTSVYVGVQTLENSGIDRRVDLILTEAGMQWEMPECHAVWTA